MQKLIQNDKPDATLPIIIASFAADSFCTPGGLESGSGSAAASALVLVLWQLEIQGFTWRIWWHQLSGKDNLISERI